METLKNFFTPVYDRVKSPFYSTFIVSWILVNWKIFYALFSNDIHFKGYKLLHFLQNRLNICTNPFHILIFPLALSALYIFLLPYIDLIIFSFSEKIKQEKLEKKYTITKQYTVSGEKFIDLLLNYKKQKEELAILDDEIRKKETELIDREKAHNELLSKVANLEINFQKSIPVSLNTFFQGNWVCKHRSDLTAEPEREEFEIEGGLYMVKNNDYVNKIEYEIKNIIFDTQNKKLSFYKIQYKSEKEFESIKYAELYEKDGKFSGTEKTFYMRSPIQIIYVNYSPVYDV